MPMLSSVLGFSLFGLAARFGQLGIQKRNLFENMSGHAIAMGTFGFAGYWAHVWDVRAGELLKIKKDQIAEARRQRLAAVERASEEAGLE